MPLQPLNSPDAIRILVNAFYEKVMVDPLISPVFVDVAQVDWASHLPKMYAFWETIILGNNAYSGQPFHPHLIVNQYHPLHSEHFERWLQLFYATLAEHFTAETAEPVQQRATQIAMVWNHKLSHLNNASV